MNTLSFAGIVMVMGLLFGCGDGPATGISQGTIEFPGVRGPITAKEALALVLPTAQKTSGKPVLVLITSGSDINGEGLSSRWEFVFHFPDQLSQAVYSFESGDPEVSDSPLHLSWRLSPRPGAKGDEAGLPLDFTDSPEAARRLSDRGLDWIAGDPDITLATKRLSSGKAVWVVESYGKELTVPFERTNL